MPVQEDVRRRRFVVAGTIVAAVLATGVVVAVAGQSSAEPDSPSRVGGGGSPRGPGAVIQTSEVAGMSSSFSESDDGAVQAGVAFATASQRWLYFTDAEIAAAVDQIATAGSAARIEDEIVADVSEARDRLGASPGRVWWLVRPLAWTLDERTGDAARVSVWVVTVLSAAEVAAPQAEWMTVSIDLRWEQGDWRVDESRSVHGPTPMIGPGDSPWDAVPFDEGLEGFTRMDGEPVR